MRTGTEKEKKAMQVVEQLIDETSLQIVMDAIAAICTEKGQYIVCTWQDRPLAGWWFRRGNLIAGTAAKIGMENT